MAESRLMETDDGQVFEYIDENEAIFLYNEIFVRKAYELGGLVRFPSPSGTSDGVIIDVGANIGLFSLYCASRSPMTHIIAIEPIPPIYDVLARNVAALPNVTTLKYAVGGSQGPSSDSFTYYPQLPGESTRFPLQKAAQHALVYRDEATATETQVFTCRIRTLTDILNEIAEHSRHPLRVDLLKIDVEGSELDVLEGISEQHWQIIEQIIVEVEDMDQHRLPAVKNMLLSHHFQITVIPQQSTIFEGYATTIPAALRLFHVFATRNLPSA